ncbi:MAG TPA: DUF1345 domain-containing protein [Mycoplana sp.]|nr:DUF1345 domain-containing protein [Mycoplana sp.]
MSRLSLRPIALERHRPFLAAVVTAAAACAVSLSLKPDLVLQLPATGFFLVYLLLVARRIPRLDAGYLRKHATDTDEPAPVIFAVTLGAFVVSLGSLFSVLNHSGRVRPDEFVLSFASVVLGWFTIHTMAALHYAHFYWRPYGGKTLQPQQRGLDFPHTDQPAIYDFLYFAFVVGMTAQTSDVAITTTAMRKINLAHAIASFFFNTVLVAAAVNAAVALAS